MCSPLLVCLCSSELVLVMLLKISFTTNHTPLLPGFQLLNFWSHVEIEMVIWGALVLSSDRCMADRVMAGQSLMLREKGSWSIRWHLIYFSITPVLRNVITALSHMYWEMLDFILFWKCMHKFVLDVKVIPGEEVALQHQLLVYDMKTIIPSLDKHRFTTCLRVWKLKDAQMSCCFQEVFDSHHVVSTM